jgi:hypothetical protein
VTFTQFIVPDAGERVPPHPHDGSEISGEAVFLTVRANKILAGTIDGKEIVVSGGADGILRSDGFVAGSAGWAVFGDGTAEFNDVLVRGDIESGNWDGVSPLDLSSVDSTATQGFALDSSEGAMQLEGNLFANGDIFFTGTIKTADSGDRVEISQSAGSLTLATKTSAGATPSSIALDAGGSIDIRGDGAESLTLTDFLNIDLLSSTPGTVAVPELRLGNDSGLFKLNLEGNRGIRVPVGSETVPSISFVDDTDLGLFRTTSNVLSVAAGGGEVLRISSAGLRIPDGDATTPAVTFLSDADTGIYHVSANIIGFAAGGGFALQVDSVGLNPLNGSNTAPSYRFLNDANTGMYLVSADLLGFAAGGIAKLSIGTDDIIFRDSGGEIAGFFDDSVPAWRFFAAGSVSGAENLRIVNGGSGSSLFLDDGLTDVGNHETLRLDRGTGGTLRAVGWFSSWASGKNDIIPLIDSPRFPGLHIIDQLNAVDFERKSTEMREWGFVLDEFKNLDDNLRYLTTKGDNWGGSPDEFAISAVLWEGLKDLRKRVTGLETDGGKK